LSILITALLCVQGDLAGQMRSDISFFFRMQQDLHLIKLMFQSTYSTNRDFQFKNYYEVTSADAIECTNFHSLGVRIDF